MHWQQGLHTVPHYLSLPLTLASPAILTTFCFQEQATPTSGFAIVLPFNWEVLYLESTEVIPFISFRFLLNDYCSVNNSLDILFITANLIHPYPTMSLFKTCFVFLCRRYHHLTTINFSYFLCLIILNCKLHELFCPFCSLLYFHS